MALKATIHKAELQIADIDRGFYGDHALTIARHPSETDERMMVRLLAYALNVPADASDGALELAKSLWDNDEPDLWRKDLTGRIIHWIDVGQPDDRRILRACGRAERVTVHRLQLGHTDLVERHCRKACPCTRTSTSGACAPESAAELAGLAQRGMRLQVTVQEGGIMVGDGETVGRGPDATAASTRRLIAGSPADRRGAPQPARPSRSRAARYSRARRSTSWRAGTTCLMAPTPWPLPQMSFHALRPPPKLILLGSLSGKASGSSPALRIDAFR